MSYMNKFFDFLKFCGCLLQISAVIARNVRLGNKPPDLPTNFCFKQIKLLIF